MKKLLLPIISLVIGAATSGGTIYGVQTFNHKKEINEWRALLQQEKQNAQSMIEKLNEQLTAAEAKNREINDYINSLNTKISKDFGLAKGVYEEAVKLTTYTVNDHEEKNVTYYLAYYDVQNKQIVATMDSTTKLQDKQEAIPATLEDLLANDKGIKVEHLVDGRLKTDTLTKDRFNAKEFTTLNKVDATQKIIEDVLKKAHQGGEKLIKFFQDKLNELTKLKKDLETIDVEDFVNLLGKLEKGIDKETWKTKNTKEKLDKIKELLTTLEGEWSALSTWVTNNLNRFEKLVNDSIEIADRLKNDTDPLPKKPEAEEESDDDSSSETELETALVVS